MKAGKVGSMRGGNVRQNKGIGKAREGYVRGNEGVARGVRRSKKEGSM